MSATIGVSNKMGHSLLAALTIRAKALGYRSRGAYLRALARYDLDVGIDHTRPLAWAGKRLVEQDALDAALLKKTQRKEGKKRK